MLLGCAIALLDRACSMLGPVDAVAVNGLAQDPRTCFVGQARNRLAHFLCLDHMHAAPRTCALCASWHPAQPCLLLCDIYPAALMVTAHMGTHEW